MEEGKPTNSYPEPLESAVSVPVADASDHLEGTAPAYPVMTGMETSATPATVNAPHNNNNNRLPGTATPPKQH